MNTRKNSNFYLSWFVLFSRSFAITVAHFQKERPTFTRTVSDYDFVWLEKWLHVQGKPRLFGCSGRWPSAIGPHGPYLVPSIQVGKSQGGRYPRSGRSRTAANDQMIDAVRASIEDDPHSTYIQIEAILGISSPSINLIVHDHLNLRKVCARWVPHQLTDDQKQTRVQFCHQALNRF